MFLFHLFISYFKNNKMAYFLDLPQHNEVIRLQIDEDTDYFCEIKKYTGSYGEYYSVNAVYYDIHFPIEWVFQTPVNAQDMIFGPETCYDCFKNGYYNGVFIGYCVNCASICNYTRGNGLINGIEVECEDEPDLHPNNSIFNLYLQTVSMDEIGDRQLNIDYYYKIYHAEHGMNNHDEIYIPIHPTYDNDDNTVIYNDSIVYSSSNDEDDATIAFSAYTNDQDFVEVDSFENYDDDYDDIFMEIDSIS